MRFASRIKKKNGESHSTRGTPNTKHTKTSLTPLNHPPSTPLPLSLARPARPARPFSCMHSFLLPRRRVQQGRPCSALDGRQVGVDSRPALLQVVDAGFLVAGLDALSQDLSERRVCAVWGVGCGVWGE